jgi:hypothetical protein
MTSDALRHGMPVETPDPPLLPDALNGDPARDVHRTVGGHAQPHAPGCDIVNLEATVRVDRGRDDSLDSLHLYISDGPDYLPEQ